MKTANILSHLILSVACLLSSFALSAEPSPPQVLASVRVGNGTGSGTVIVKGPERSYVLTCNHVFGRVDGEVLLETVAGDRIHARCVATDAESDLSLLRSYSDGIIAEADLADDVDVKTAHFTSCGFPKGVGPNQTTLAYLGTASDCGHWRFMVKSGTYAPGVSGGGLYADGKLCGVTSAIEHDVTPHTINRHQVFVFLTRNRDKFIDPGCPNSVCPPGSKPWLQPNVPIVVPPLVPQPHAELPDAEGKRDNSVFKDSAATARILALEKRVEALEKLISGQVISDSGKVPPPPPETTSVTSERGPKGDRGPAGPAPSSESIEDAVARWINENLAMLKGRDGKPGPQGPAGLVTVIIKKPDGTADRHPNLSNGELFIDVEEIVKRSK